MKNALILIDIQKDYFKGGKFELSHPKEAAKNARDLLTYFRGKNLPVIHIQHINESAKALFFVKDTVGIKIHDWVSPQEHEKVFIKSVPNSFYGTGLHEELRRLAIEELTVCGMMSHMCIDTTVRAAKDLGYSVTLIHDACTTRDLQWDGNLIPAEMVHKTFMAALNGSFAHLISTDMFLREIKKSVIE